MHPQKPAHVCTHLKPMKNVQSIREGPSRQQRSKWWCVSEGEGKREWDFGRKMFHPISATHVTLYHTKPRNRQQQLQKDLHQQKHFRKIYALHSYAFSCPAVTCRFVPSPSFYQNYALPIWVPKAAHPVWIYAAQLGKVNEKIWIRSCIGLHSTAFHSSSLHTFIIWSLALNLLSTTIFTVTKPLQQFICGTLKAFPVQWFTTCNRVVNEEEKFHFPLLFHSHAMKKRGGYEKTERKMEENNELCKTW